MSHHSRELSDLDWDRKPLSNLVVRALDEKTKKNINGRDGGTWSNAAPITIGGAGVDLLGPTHVSGASYAIATAPGKHIVHGRLDAEDYITLAAGHAARGRQCVTSVAPVSGDYGTTSQDGTVLTGDVRTRATGARFFAAPLRVHHGGTLTTIELHWLVAGSRAGVPAYRPRFRVVRVDREGTIEVLRINPGDTDAEGFMQLGSAVSAAAYVASNGMQTFAYAITETAKATVDTSRFVYLAEIIEESGSDALGLNSFCNIVATHVNIPNLGPQ